MKAFILICIFVLFQFSKGSENNAEDPKEQNVLKKIIYWNRQHPKGQFVISLLTRWGTHALHESTSPPPPSPFSAALGPLLYSQIKKKIVNLETVEFAFGITWGQRQLTDCKT